MQNYLTELIESMKLKIGEKVKLIDVGGVEWVGYKQNSVAYIVGVDEDGFFEVSYNLNDRHGWKADLNEVQFIN